MAELNSYLATHNPDILMLNETWLKKSIKKSELFPADICKLSVLIAQILHTPSIQIILASLGAMVAVSLILIAIRRDIDVKSNKVELKCSGEILAVTLTFNDGKKLILCSYYRVGTLGVDNHNIVRDYIKKS